MNTTYYKAEIAYMKPDESTGEEKLAKGTYLFAAVNYTDAELRVHTEAAKIVPAGRSFTVNRIDKLVLGALAKDNYKPYYLAKLAYVIEDEKGPKTIKANALVGADSLTEAAKLAVDEFAMAEPEVLAIAKTNILEYFDGKEA